MSLLLNLEELNDRHDTTTLNRIKLFDTILMSCHNKIKKYNKDFKKQECLYEPPVFIIGKPPYNYIDLINHLIDSLKNNGLRVEWLSKKKALYISWKPIDVDLEQYHSNFSDTVYDDNNENNNDNPDLSSMKVMTVRSQPNSMSKTKKKVDPPVVQHVAMIKYGRNTKDLIPVNINGFNKVNGGLRP